jgi:tRNA(Leu) C34 or U34 (ribose-2'-O)-methylase TrmL
MKKQPMGVAPALVFLNPKSSHNVARALRLASCFGLQQVWYTGDRVREEMERVGRLPREERMKAYGDVNLLTHPRPLDRFQGCTPVAVEVRERAENLHEFVHPPNPVYVFGPEDGSIDRSILAVCHRFLVINTRHCVNVTDAAIAILWDRDHKLWLNGELELVTPGEWERRGPYREEP